MRQIPRFIELFLVVTDFDTVAYVHDIVKRAKFKGENLRVHCIHRVRKNGP